MNNIIMDDLLEDIKIGRYKANEKLPSSNKLATIYNVSRMEIRKIYSKLEAMGYVYSFQGRGCYLNEIGRAHV